MKFGVPIGAKEGAQEIKFGCSGAQEVNLELKEVPSR